MDGKTLRRSHDRRVGKEAIPHGQRLGLGELPGAGSDPDGR